MNCARCQHDNRPGARFCEECGAPLVPACPSYTPRDLAEKILASRSAVEGERKQVTVLFADLKGSMELLADRDPEEGRQILDPVLEFMMQAVHRYEGMVNQVMGDGIMALFGAPIAHEDHAVRACYAALRMQELLRRHGEQLRRGHDLRVEIRVGINSGEVVVRSIGSDLHMDYTAVGVTTHLAARMEQMADPGSILITRDTLRLADGYIEARERGYLPVKGLDSPVEVYEVVGPGPVHHPLEAAAARGLTQFVGREAEVDQLASALESVALGRGQVIGVVGEPGVGKSRLVHEFTRPERMRAWFVLKTAAASYDKTTPYLPVVHLLKSYFKVHDGSDHRDVREKIVTRVIALDRALTSAIPAFLALLDVPTEDAEWESLNPRHRRRRIMEAVRALLFRESQVQPVCLVVEDLHWIDSETQAFLDMLVDGLPTVRLLLLVDYRPEYRHPWGSKTYYTQIRVDPLPRRNASELLRLLLGAEPDLDPLKRLLIDRTEGNPFFLEESVRTLVENRTLVGQPGAYRLAHSIETIQVPSTVQAVLASRIDRLSYDDKPLLQAASVIGERAPLGLLQAVTEVPEDELKDRLGRLQSAELLYEMTVFPEAEYVFKHGLTCRVAYNSLLRERRTALHARIVKAIERLYPARLAEHVERLAHHAGEGELWDDAVRYLQQSGAKAFARSANREAVAKYEQALEMLKRTMPTPGALARAADLHLALRNALTLLGEHERTLGHLREARALAERIKDRRRLGRALSFEVNCLFLLADYDAAIAAGEAARAVADELADVPLRTVTDIYIGRAYVHMGEFTRAIELFSAIVASLGGALAHDHLGLPVLPSVFARSHLVEALSEVGRFDEGARYAEEGLALAVTTNHPDTLLWAYHGLGVHHLTRRDLVPAIDALERAYSLCRTHDMPAYSPRVGAELGLAWALSGRVKEAVPMVDTALAESAARKQRASYSQVLLLRAEVYLLADRADEARASWTKALELFRERRERGHEASAMRLLADIAAKTGSSEAVSCYAEAATHAEGLGMRPLAARCHLGLGQLLVQTGDTARGAHELRAAATDFAAMDMAADLALARSALGALQIA